MKNEEKVSERPVRREIVDAEKSIDGDLLFRVGARLNWNLVVETECQSGETLEIGVEGFTFTARCGRVLDEMKDSFTFFI